MRNIAELFPVKPRPGQVEAAETLAGLLESGGAVVFTAPPGFGKTLTVLVALKAGFLPAAWRVRALALARHIAEEAALLDLRSEVLPGREKVCPYALELGSDVHEWCRVRRDQCGYFTARSCPYFFHPSADVYVFNYFRRAPPRIIDVWDEAHNLLVPREVCVNTEVFIEAAGELRSSGSNELAKWLRSFLPFLERGEGEVPVDDNQVSSLHVAYLRLLERGGRRTALGRLYRVLRAQSVYVEGGYLCGASVAIPRRRPALFISATLPYPDLLGGKVVEVPWSRKYRAIITEGLTTRFDEFGEKEVKEYGKLLWDLRKKYEKVLVFATERVAKSLSKFTDLYEPPEIPEWKGVLLLHTRGKFAEGVDIRADVVVMAGAPFPPPWVTSRLRRTLSKMGFSGADRIAEASMLSTTLQCVGRATRRPEDDPLVILADERYKRYEEELSKYFIF
ncbi:MAG: helicase C-terminal domain-containing protein [Thermofilum sp.]|uniref:ATP-dependent helicase C-terminal domain-containing protein n=1 Tax=Thermofilum pendens TaxID=2269 RepID=A0A7C4D1J0_THEPE